MLEPIKRHYHKVISHYHLQNLKDVIIFIALILIFTLAGYIWKQYFGYKILGVHILNPGYKFLIKYIVLASYWILTTIFLIPLSYALDTSRLYFSDVSYIFIYNGCSGLKEMAMFLFIMLFFPGRLLAKLWFIPVSLVIIYVMAILRIVFLALVFKYAPTWFPFLHDYLFNVIFFFLFFVLWLVWVKWFYKKKPVFSKSNLKPKVD